MPRERNTSPLFILVAIIAVIAALYLAKQILLPIALAVLLSFLLTPLANWIERWRVPRIPAVILVVAVAFAMLGLVGWVVTGQLVELSQELPNHRRQVIEKLQSLRAVTAKMEAVGKDLAKTDPTAPRKDGKPAPDRPAEPSEQLDPTSPGPAENQLARESASTKPAPERALERGEISSDDEAVAVKVVSLPPSPLTQVQTWLGPLVAPLTATGMVFVLVFFMLMDRENQRNRLIQLFGTSNLHATTEALHEATHRVGRYLRMLFLINAGYGFAVGLGLWLLGVPGAMMWGVLGFALRFLPYLGPWIAAVLPIIVSLAVSPGWTQPLLVVGMYLLYELVLNNVAEPLLYGNSIGVSTVGVIVSAIFWTWLWGPIGLVLAMPMTVCLVVLARYVPQLRFLTVMLADQPPLTPAERIYQRLLAFDYQEPLKLARHRLKSESLVSFYDEVLIPALVLSERDRYAGLLNESQEEFVVEAAEDLVEELGESVFAAHALGTAAENAASNDAPTMGDVPTERVLCVPLRDAADEVASRMLAQLLAAEGFHVETGGAESLTSEVLDRVAASDSDVVVISILPPIGARDSRLLWKRLRQRYPDLPIIVGYWTGAGQEISLPHPEEDEPHKIATTLTDAVSLVRNTAAQVRLSKAV
jgi:predicted PurR-regulated permease PerM/methylmalonyl-CoA mutase cobalamin-binding subunit